ncbi:MAG: ATP-binding cassette domain-containing protein [Thermoleophilia bacterium]
MLGSRAVPAIETDGLTKVYGGDTNALDGITFRVDGGELFGLLGPNGAGKTTAIRILSTLLRPTAGSARVLGLDVVADARQVRLRLGLALQTPALDAFSTGRETLELAGRMHGMKMLDIRRRTDELLELMGLSKVATKLTGTYSGGMKRRLDLASALVHCPDLLILDEPTEGLDPQSRSALWEELERINAAGTTMLLTTHYMEEADRLCSRLAIIDSGSIVVEGGPEELKHAIGADTVVLQLDGGGPGADGGDPVEHVRDLLDGMVPRDDVVAHPAGVSLSVPNAGGAVPDLLRRLEVNGLRVTGLQVRQPSLDDVFLKHTGRSIREESADQPILLGW